METWLYIKLESWRLPWSLDALHNGLARPVDFCFCMGMDLPACGWVHVGIAMNSAALNSVMSEASMAGVLAYVGVACPEGELKLAQDRHKDGQGEKIIPTLQDVLCIRCRVIKTLSVCIVNSLVYVSFCAFYDLIVQWCSIVPRTGWKITQYVYMTCNHLISVLFNVASLATSCTEIIMLQHCYICWPITFWVDYSSEQLMTTCVFWQCSVFSVYE